VTIEIKDRYTDRVIYSSDKAKDIKECLEEAVKAGANLQDANLQYANLQGANLQDANLQDANLQGANLQYANLQYAKLQDAKLQYAKLQDANLQDAKDFNKYKVQPLLMLLDQPGKLRFYKAVSKDLCSPTSDTVIQYKIGGKVSVEDANTDEYNLCAAGINVATLDWILKEYRHTQVRILVIECTANDIACIPVTSDGKIRLHRGKVVAELDYERYGLKNPLDADLANDIRELIEG
jgi:hypothetical protein